MFALFVKEDEFHEKASALAEQQQGELFACSFLVFQEFMTLLMSKVGSQMAAKIGKDLLDPDSSVQFLKIDEEYFANTWSLFESMGTHKLSFVDVSLITLAKHLEAKVLTFDQGLERALAA